jgi:glucitol operon activator protein
MTWKTGLLLFALCWALQIAGTALQMRHYRRVLGALEARWTDGYIGSGSARARFGRGAIMILVVSPAGIVRDALLMQGRTVWAKFKPLPGLAGLDIATVGEGSPFPPRDARLTTAFRQCLHQIERVSAATRTASHASSHAA